MSDEEIVGKIKEYKAIQVEWEIEDFFFKNLFLKFIEFNSPKFDGFGSTWMLRLDHDCSNWILHAIRVGGDDDERCKLGLKKLDGSVEYFPSGIEECTIPEFSEKAVICRQELLSRKIELVPSNVMTVVCTLRCGSNHSVQKSRLLKQTQLIKLDTLCENFKQIFTNKDGCDVILRVKEKEFHAHKTVLMARSSVFASMFRHDLSENKTGVITIPDCDPDSFHEFLEYLYCGKLDDVSFSSIFHLYSTSDKYDVQELKAFCVSYMEQCLADDNVSDVAILADLYDEAQLFSAVQSYFNKNIGKIVRTIQWENLMKTNYRLANKLIIDMTSKIQRNGCSS